MTNAPTQFSTCPHCSVETPVPSEEEPNVFMVAYARVVCSACNSPHIAPKRFTRDEVQSIILRHAEWLTGQHSDNPNKDTIPDE